MTNEQKAYLAGILDGEGSIYIGRTTTRKKPIYQMQVAVEITDSKVTDMLHELAGGSVRLRYKKKQNGELYKTIYAWVAYGITATNFLAEVYPYLLIKKERAALAIEYREMCLVKATRAISEQDIVNRHEFYVKMRLLNA